MTRIATLIVTAAAIVGTPAMAATYAGKPAIQPATSRIIARRSIVTRRWQLARCSRMAGAPAGSISPCIRRRRFSAITCSVAAFATGFLG